MESTKRPEFEIRDGKLFITKLEHLMNVVLLQNIGKNLNNLIIHFMFSRYQIL